MSAPTLRWYQQEAVEAVWGYWRGGGKHPLVELPTGAGKSLVLGEVARRVAEKGSRTLIVTHRKELIEQDARAVRALAPHIPVGVYSAGLHSRQVRSVTVGGVQSLYRRAHVLGKIDLVIVDEAHLVPPAGDGQYARLLRDLRDVNPALRVMGLTATPHRLGQGLLTEGSDALFTSVAYRAPVLRLISEGYLSRIVTGDVTAQVDAAAVRTRMGEFVAADLELACDVEKVTDAVARDITESRRRHVIAFGVSVAHAAHLRNALRMSGIASEMVTGETPPQERKRILDAFKRGELQSLTGCDVLTTGFDAPLTDCVALVRPTMSPALYIQIVGRGMRVADGKSDCLLLDYGGNVARHGPVDAVRVFARTPGVARDDERPYKICPECAAMAAPALRVCAECGHEWPAPERKANARASALPALSDGMPEPEEAVCEEVMQVSYDLHVGKNSGSKTLRADYTLARVSSRWPVSEYVCLEHTGFARSKAEKWWRDHGGALPIPSTILEALDREHELFSVDAIWTKKDGKFTKVEKCEFGERPERQREPGDDDEKDDPDARATKDRLDDDFFYDDELPF